MTARCAIPPLSAWLLAAAVAVGGLFPTGARAADPAPVVAGVDYAEIPKGARLGPDDGKVEVVEVFAYTCHHCANFAPMLDAWKRRQGRDVRVSYLPLPYGPNDALAQAYFAAEQIGALSRTHDATFRAIHDEGLLPRNPTADEVATFYASKGVDAARLKTAMASPAVQERLPVARAFAIRSDVEGTPTLIVNGRYRVLGRNLEDVLRIADALVARERKARR